MSKRKEITDMLSKALEYHLNPKKDPRIYISKEVTFDYATSHSIRVDYMKFKPLNTSPSGIEKGDFYCYEIKSCREDFKSKNGHNFIGDFNYYVIPAELYNELSSELPYGIGVYTYNEESSMRDKLTNARKAKRKNRNRSVSEMLLMMYRSNQRDLLKKE